MEPTLVDREGPWQASNPEEQPSGKLSDCTSTEGPVYHPRRGTLREVNRYNPRSQPAGPANERANVIRVRVRVRVRITLQ